MSVGAEVGEGEGIGKTTENFAAGDLKFKIGVPRKTKNHKKCLFFLFFYLVFTSTVDTMFSQLSLRLVQ